MLNSKTLREHLEELDEIAYMRFPDTLYKGETYRPRVVIVGGCALMLHGLSCRVTDDIDVFEADEQAQEILRQSSYVNYNANAYSCNIPFNFEDRVVHLDIGTNTIDFCVPSLEDLCVMKLYRWEDIDKKDMENEEFASAIDWDLLHDLVYSADEAEASRISEPANDVNLSVMRQSYEQYVWTFRSELLDNDEEKERKL